MSSDISEIIETAEGTIDEELLVTQGDGGLISTGYLHDRPLVEYLHAEESLQYLFDNTKRGITVTRDGEEKSLKPGSNYRTLAAITSERVLFVLGNADGDDIVEIPLSEVTNVEVSSGFRNDRLDITSTEGTIEFYTRSNSDITAAVEYIDWRRGTLAERQSTADQDELNGNREEARANGGRVTENEPLGVDSGASNRASSTLSYVVSETPSESVIETVQSAESTIEQVGTEIEDIDTARTLLTQAHNDLCHVAVEDASSVDGDALEERIDVVERRLDALQEAARHLEAMEQLATVESSGDSEAVVGDAYEAALDAAAEADLQLTEIEAKRVAVQSSAEGGTKVETQPTEDDSETVADESIADEGDEPSSKRIEMIETIEDATIELGQIPKYDDMHDVGPYKAQEYTEEFGSWRDALDMTDLDIEEWLIADLQSVGEKLGRAPTRSETDEYGTYGSDRHYNYFEDYDAALDAAGLEKPSREELLEDLRRLQDELGYVPNSTHVDAEVAYPVTFYRKEFGSVRKAAEEAGMEYEQEILDAIRAIAVVLDRRPKSKDFDEYAQYSSSYVYNYFDGWRDACEAAGVDSDEAVAEFIADLSSSGMDELLEESAATDELVAEYRETVEAERGDESTILDTIRAIALAVERRPNSTEYNQFTQSTNSSIYDYFDSWDSACEAAGVGSKDDVEAMLTDLSQSEVRAILDNAELTDAFQQTHPDVDDMDGGDDVEEDDENDARQDRLITELEEVIDELGRLPTYSEMYEYDEIDPRVYTGTFGSWEAVLRATSIDVDSRLLTALEELGSELDRAPTKAEVDEQGTYDSEWYEEYFDSWEDAVSAAGLESPSRHDLLDDLERLQGELGFVPARHHVEEHGKYPPRFYRSRFGSVKQATTKAGMDYRDDVIEAIRELAVELGRKPKSSDFDERAPYSNSYVYDLFDSWAEACVTADVNSNEAVQQLAEERRPTATEDYSSDTEPTEDGQDTDSTNNEGSDENPTDDKPNSGDAAETDSDVPASPLAEYYEVFGNLLTVQRALLGEDLAEHLGESEPMSRWHTTVHARWAGESTGQFERSYGAQQNERTEFSMEDYRDAYGNGERVTEFQAVETAPLPESIVELVSYLSSMERSEAATIRIPKTPDSGESLPVLVESTAAYDRATSLLEAFPDQPEAAPSQRDETYGVEEDGDSATGTDESHPDRTGTSDTGDEDTAEDDTDDELGDIGGVTPSVERALRDAGYHSKADLKAADKDELAAIEGIKSQRANRIKMIVGS